MSRPPPWNDFEVGLLASLLDEIIPPSPDKRIPGAGALGVADFVVSACTSDPTLSIRVRDGLSRVATTSADQGGEFRDLEAAEQLYEARRRHELEYEPAAGGPEDVMAPIDRAAAISDLASDMAVARAIEGALRDTEGKGVLSLAALLLAIILLLAQGGGYVGGAAVAANAAKLGRLPGFFADDRIGIAVIWGFSAAAIPLIREVVVVEAYYAFGFVSAFIITSTTVFLARDEALRDRGIMPGSSEARSLRFAGFRGMLASYGMGIVLITQKTDALGVIVVAAALITVFQLYYAYGGARRDRAKLAPYQPAPAQKPDYESGIQRAHDKARARGSSLSTSMSRYRIRSGTIANSRTSSSHRAGTPRTRARAIIE